MDVEKRQMGIEKTSNKNKTTDASLVQSCTYCDVKKMSNECRKDVKMEQAKRTVHHYSLIVTSKKTSKVTQMDTEMTSK